MKRERGEDKQQDVSATPSISEADAKLYDRQIRLWGAASQQKIFQARVLAVGVSGVVSETLKNLALAGVGVLEIVDSAVVTESDIGPNLLLGRQDLGQNRALACKERLRELNPRVQVVVSARTTRSLEPAFLASFNAVICSSVVLGDALWLNGAVRAAAQDAVFFATATHGRAGFAFCDASNHCFRLEGSDAEVRLQALPSFQQVCQSKPLSGKRASPQLLAQQLLWRFQASRQRLPSAADVPALLDLQQELVGGSSAALPEAQLVQLARDAATELSPVCAVVGGIVGQQVLRVLTRVGKPIDNVFVFDSASQVVGKIDHIE